MPAKPELRAESPTAAVFRRPPGSACDQFRSRSRCLATRSFRPFFLLPSSFDDVAPQNLVISNTGGTVALKLTCPTSPGQNTIVRASAPVSQGREWWKDFRILGMCPTPAQGSADITSLYTAQYGAPPVGTKVFVNVSLLVDGWESIPVGFWGIVPASA